MFLPVFLTVYYVTPARFRNCIILVFSLAFYFVDAGTLTLILCASIVLNYFLALYLHRAGGRAKNLALVVGLLLNLAPLLYYKYWMFLQRSVNDGAHLIAGNRPFEVASILLPAGISFFTFHSISYLVDIYWRKVKPATSLIDFGMYMANFPQLIAGPIVRYSEIVHVVRTRAIRMDQVYLGLFIFIIGLSKKIILADHAGVVADTVFGMPANQLTLGYAWLGAFAYSLQIYFDFSGYTDMAIGLGRMMGFEFPQNFNQPYRSHSVTEFWRRWHMTLSRWFRDYVYIPLGGNRTGGARTFFNLFLVFFLCGLWHGAAYGFVAWGMYHGLLLIIERMLLTRFGFKPSGWSGQALTFLLVMFGWVLFRASSLDLAIGYLGVMFGLKHAVTAPLMAYQPGLDSVLFLLLGALCAVFPSERLRSWAAQGLGLATAAQIFSMAALMAYSCMLIVVNGFNPFIYFQF
ncbi:MAG: MBOAT family protein [Glaciimonas sp.]|nr:MBOAT family protein [Glaciimonas sp.]